MVVTMLERNEQREAIRLSPAEGKRWRLWLHGSWRPTGISVE